MSLTQAKITQVGKLKLIGFWVFVFFSLAQNALADGIVVNDAKVSLSEGVYFLDVNIDYEFNDTLLHALHNGLALTFRVDVSITRERSYLWRDTVAELEQRYRLVYHALTQQYLVHNLNSGAQYSVPTIGIVKSVLGTIVKLPIIDQNIVDDRQAFYGQVRVELETNDLPLPIKLASYFSSEWNLNSEWFSWSFQ